jgi:hypothetical protein
MQRRHTLRAAAGALAVAGSLAVAGGATAQDDTNYILSTASTGGTYYPVGVALSTLTKVKLQPDHGIGMSAINSAGSGENVRLLREDEAQFAILQGLFGYYARTGTGPVAEPQENLRAVSMLWQNVEHFVVANAHVQEGTLTDLVDMTGEAMAMGRRNSGTIGSNRTLLEGFGIDIDEDYDLLYAGYTPSAEALQNGQVAGMGVPGGAPVGAISQLLAAAGDGFTVLEVTDEELATADGGKGLWTRYVIPAGTYPNQEEDIRTIAQPNFLAVRDDVPEEHVYLFTKTVFENLPFLQAIHPATNAMSLEAALAGLPFPLHPGAARYFEEAGLDIPERLVAD